MTIQEEIEQKQAELLELQTLRDELPPGWVYSGPGRATRTIGGTPRTADVRFLDPPRPTIAEACVAMERVLLEFAQGIVAELT